MVGVMVAATVLTLIVNVGYGLIFLVWQGIPLPEAMGILQAGGPYFVLGIFLAVVGAILSARLAAHLAGRSPRLIGLVTGVGLALIVVVIGLIQGRLDFWLPPNALMAVFGGGLSGGQSET